jgi:hypothetical protein
MKVVIFAGGKGIITFEESLLKLKPMKENGGRLANLLLNQNLMLCQFK